MARTLTELHHLLLNLVATGASLPFALSNQRPLPDFLDGSLMGSEGGSYYWLFRNLLNFNMWAGCAATGSARSVTPGTHKTGGKDWKVPPGWSVHSTLWQPNGGGQYWPFATVISKGSEVVLLVRGSQTEYDWKSDFDYSTTSASLGAILLPGRIHQGFARVAASLWPGVQAALQSLSATHKITNVYIAGHSLGAGVSTLLAYGIQVRRECEWQPMGVAARPLWVGCSCADVCWCRCAAPQSIACAGVHD